MAQKVYKVGDTVKIARQTSHRKGEEYVIVEVRGGGSNYVATLKGCEPWEAIVTTTIGADELVKPAVEVEYLGHYKCFDTKKAAISFFRKEMKEAVTSYVRHEAMAIFDKLNG